MIDVYKALDLAAENDWTIEFCRAQRIVTVLDSRLTEKSARTVVGQARWGRNLPDTEPISALISAVEKADQMVSGAHL